MQKGDMREFKSKKVRKKKREEREKTTEGISGTY